MQNRKEHLKRKWRKLETQRRRIDNQMGLVSGEREAIKDFEISLQADDGLDRHGMPLDRMPPPFRGYGKNP
jgi:hypothetical protein